MGKLKFLLLTESDEGPGDEVDGEVCGLEVNPALPLLLLLGREEGGLGLARLQMSTV